MKKKFFTDKMFYLFLLVTLMFFGLFIKFNFSVDTYLLLSSPDLSYIQEHFSNGRLFTFGMFKIFQILKFNLNGMYFMSYLIGIICVTFAIYELFKVLKKYIKNDILNSIISILIVINPFIIELWLFIEMGIMMLSILSCVLAFKYFDRYLETKQKNSFIYSMLFMFIALFSYQGTVAIFIGLSIISILKYSNNIKNFIKNNLLSILCYVIPTIINYLFVILSQNNRVGSNSNYFETFKFILNATNNQLLNAFGIYPIHLFKIFILISIVIAISLIILQKNNLKHKIFLFLKLCYLITMIYLFTIAPIIPQNIDSAVMFPRTTYAFGSLIGLIFVFSIIFLNNNKNFNCFKNAIIAISIIILAVQFYKFNNIAINRYVVNYTDKYIIRAIEEKIENYEQETGNTISKLALYNLSNSKKFYPELEDMINVSARSEELSSKSMLSYYMKRKIELIDSSNYIYDKFFENKKWSTFSLDQIVLENDTMHWYIY